MSVFTTKVEAGVASAITALALAVVMRHMLAYVGSETELTAGGIKETASKKYGF